MAAEGISENRTLSEEQQRILCQIRATFDYMPSDPDEAAELMPWLEWQVDEILARVPRSEYKPAEMIALVGLLGPTFARFLGRTSPIPPTPKRPVAPLRIL
ncbi:hypothetical protein [Mycolicibacterium setense]